VQFLSTDAMGLTSAQHHTTICSVVCHPGVKTAQDMSLCFAQRCVDEAMPSTRVHSSITESQSIITVIRDTDAACAILRGCPASMTLSALIRSSCGNHILLHSMPDPLAHAGRRSPLSTPMARKHRHVTFCPTFDG